MTTFIIVALLVLGVIVGNLMLLRPSGRDQRLNAQRQQAQAMGVQVRLQAAPTWLAQGAGQGMLAQYTWPVAWPDKLQGRWRWHEGLRSWQPVSESPAWLLKDELPTPPPAGWQALDVMPKAITVYWREDGKADSVVIMRDVLNGLSA